MKGLTFHTVIFSEVVAVLLTIKQLLPSKIWKVGHGKGKQMSKGLFILVLFSNALIVLAFVHIEKGMFHLWYCSRCLWGLEEGNKFPKMTCKGGYWAMGLLLIELKPEIIQGPK